MNSVWRTHNIIFTAWELWNSETGAHILSVYFTDAYGCTSAMNN